MLMNRRDKQVYDHYMTIMGREATDEKEQRALLKMFIQMDKEFPIVLVKKRTLTDLHRLWCMTKVRSEKRLKNRREFIENFIKKDIPEINGKYTVYHRDADGLYAYNISWDRDFGCYSGNHDRVKSGDRLGKLDHLLAVGIEYEYGERFRYLDHTLGTAWHRDIFQKMWKGIKDELDTYYRTQQDKRAYIEEVITIQFGANRYHVAAQNHYTGYMQYTWEGPVNDVCINFDDK